VLKPLLTKKIPITSMTYWSTASRESAAFAPQTASNQTASNHDLSHVFSELHNRTVEVGSDSGETDVAARRSPVRTTAICVLLCSSVFPQPGTLSAARTDHRRLDGDAAWLLVLRNAGETQMNTDDFLPYGSARSHMSAGRNRLRAARCRTGQWSGLLVVRQVRRHQDQTSPGKDLTAALIPSAPWRAPGMTRW
jgi:hypothetical protein